MPKRNLELFNREELEEIKDYLVSVVDGYKASIRPYRVLWEKANRAIKCLYEADDHGMPGTKSTLYDSESHDALDTIVKRIMVAIFSNKKIWQLDNPNNKQYTFNQIETAVRFLVDEMGTMNLYDKFGGIFRNGTQTGTYLSRVHNTHIDKKMMVINKDGKPVFKKVKRNKPDISYIEITKVWADPLVSDIDDSEVKAFQMFVPNKDIEDSDEYFDTEAPIKEWKTEPDEDGSQETIYWDNGIDVHQLENENKRAVLHVYFDWEYDGENTAMWAVLDAAQGKIMRIEFNPNINGECPITNGAYIKRDNMLYGIGVPELAWNLQIALNNTLNRIQDNQALNNTGIFFVGKSSLPSMKILDMKGFSFIPVTTVGDVMQLKVGNLAEAYANIDKLREEIQKKTKATRLMQGLSTGGGDTTATEAVGVREESNLTIKEILNNIKLTFMEKTFNKWKNLMVQYYDGKKVLKLPVNKEETKWITREVDFDEVREVVANCTLSIIGADETNQRLTKRGNLKELIVAAMQQPGIFNLNYLLKKFLKDDLGFDDFENMILTEQPGQPLSIEREHEILMGGEPLNISKYDDHGAHYIEHSKQLAQLQAMVQEAQGGANIDEEMFNRIMLNSTRHLKDHEVAIDAQQQNTSSPQQ